ncbi:PQQ-binding-like beta-propeller repeat protein [Halobaculum sp. P14]|uniref:outer membrane protein assembly factor BamB family protein n=1 Tax=Halobaculum sp. P14 TaxID=3421638 RepID=UPI003EBF00BF
MVNMNTEFASRRQFLAASGTLGLGSIAGCAGKFKQMVRSEPPIERSQPVGDWRQIHADTRNSGHVPEGNGPFTDQPLGSSVRWHYDDAGFRSSLVVADGKVYAGTDGELHAVDAASGRSLWRSRLREGESPLISSTPAVADGRVYLGANDGRVYALNASDGSHEWSYVLESDGWVGAPPTVVEDTAYVASNNSEGDSQGTIAALDAATGTEQWRLPLDGDVESAPAVVDGTVYVSVATAGVDNLLAIDAKTGGRRWGFSAQLRVPGAPAVVDGTVYFGDEDGWLYALDAKTGEIEWQTTPAVGLGPVASSPAVTEEMLYVTDKDEYILKFDRKTGKIRGSMELASGSGTTIQEGLSSSPVVVDGIIYVGGGDQGSSTEGTLYALTPSMKPVAAVSVGTAMNSTPVVVDGIVYVATLDGIYAIGPIQQD